MVGISLILGVVLIALIIIFIYNDNHDKMA